MRLTRWTLTVNLLIGLLPLTLWGATSQSKLGPHILGNTQDEGAQTILGACPKVVKWMTPDSNIPQEIINYRCRCPGGVVVIRVYVSGGDAYYGTANDANASAEDYWNKMQGGLAGLNPGMVDWLEGPNELDNLPDWFHDQNASNWFATFSSRLSDLINAAGYHPLVGSIAVGNPAMAGENGPGSPNYFQATANVMKQKTYRWGWHYHSYTKDLTTDWEQEKWYSLRYRTISSDCGLGGIPLVLTEGGQDIPTGWQGRGVSAEQFMNWLKWFDDRMKEDGDVVGETIFQVGEHGRWQDWDLGPVANSMADYLRSTLSGTATCDGGQNEESQNAEESIIDAGGIDEGTIEEWAVDAGSEPEPSLESLDQATDREVEIIIEGACGCGLTQHPTTEWGAIGTIPIFLLLIRRSLRLFNPPE